MEKNDTTVLILGIVALVLEIISFFIFGWLSIVGLGLGVGGVCIKTESSNNKIPAIVSIPLGVIFMIMYFVAIATIAR